MSLPHEKIEMAKTTDLAAVQSFYTSVRYGGGVHPNDRLLVSRVEKSIVAAVRLCTEGGTLVLRGMYVAEGRRGQGIGARILESISDVIGSSECWCIPYTHLTGFYSRIGFHMCEGEAIPPFPAERWERYTGSGQKVVVMKRSDI